MSAVAHPETDLAGPAVARSTPLEGRMVTSDKSLYRNQSTRSHLIAMPLLAPPPAISALAIAIHIAFLETSGNLGKLGAQRLAHWQSIVPHFLAVYGSLRQFRED